MRSCARRARPRRQRTTSCHIVRPPASARSRRSRGGGSDVRRVRSGGGSSPERRVRSHVRSTGPAPHRWRPGAARRLRLQPGDHVLDVGCGTGANVPYLVRAVGPTGRVTGIELSEAPAARASRLGRPRPVGTTSRLWSATRRAPHCRLGSTAHRSSSSTICSPRLECSTLSWALVAPVPPSLPSGPRWPPCT